MKALAIVLLLSGFQIAAQDMASCPMHKAKTEHQAAVEQLGDQAMGFPHDKTTHHFRLLADGGTIEVSVDNPKDDQNLQMIRSHLKHVVTMFSNGDFSVPMFVHSQTPPGVSEMKDRRSAIAYTFEDLPAGGRVRIATTNSDALNAIHDFLRFQIQDHHTGDSED